MGDVVQLRPEESVRLNPECLVALYAELGERNAEAVLARAMDELEQRMAEVQRHVAEGQIPGLERSARRLAKVAEQIGMETFARVAADLVQSAASSDGITRAAIASRLVRAGDRSLNAAWKLRDVMV